MSVRRTLTSLGTAVAVAGLMALGSSPAGADAYGGSSGNSFGLQAVDVVVRGGAGDPVSGGSISVSVPPVCWWGAFNSDDVDPTNAKAMEKWFTEMRNEHMRGHAAAGYFALPPAEEVERIAGSDTPHTWYQLYSRDGVNCADEGFANSFGTGGDAYGGQGAGSLADEAIPVAYAAFPTGAPLPPPAVDVDDVVEAVWDAASAEVEGPDLDRNPKIDGVGGATLVNLPTWFWVQNVQGALAEDGRIHLEISIPGTPVQATLDAATEGVQITSPAGATVCSVDAAKTEWASGVAESSACTMPFDRANAAGWPVTAQTTWTGTWQGTDRNGATGGTLNALTPSATTTVPVAESQALVTDVD